jgi:hypothetical protein
LDVEAIRDIPECGPRQFFLYCPVSFLRKSALDIWRGVLSKRRRIYQCTGYVTLVVQTYTMLKVLLALMNIVENCLNAVYLYLAHVTGSQAATVIGFMSASMTLGKTLLYWAQEYFCGGCATKQNNLQDFIVYWIIPNGCVTKNTLVWLSAI